MTHNDISASIHDPLSSSQGGIRAAMEAASISAMAAARPYLEKQLAVESIITARSLRPAGMRWSTVLPAR
jgi:hypothetical protein